MPKKILLTTLHWVGTYSNTYSCTLNQDNQVIESSVSNFIDGRIVSIGSIVFSVTEDISVSRGWVSTGERFRLYLTVSPFVRVIIIIIIINRIICIQIRRRWLIKTRSLWLFTGISAAFFLVSFTSCYSFTFFQILAEVSATQFLCSILPCLSANTLLEDTCEELSGSINLI